MDAPLAPACRIRPAESRDVDAVHEIERAVFADPWPREDFLDCIAAGADFLVAQQMQATGGGGGLSGYVVARAVVGEAEILNLAVAPGGRRRGVGRALVAAVLDALRARGAREVFLEVRESNAGARALYAAHGFREVGRRQRYYRRPVEDAIILRAAIDA